ncbi:MAG: RIP metalloprotease RseP [Proteobacteria bacterium]|nr:RIP metalloprotease RseP [Pseudomonadota bacterium]
MNLLGTLWTLFWFVVAVGLLVTVHEYGHFWVARRLGFKVLRFSVGFGRPLVKWVRGADRVEYVIAAIPLGGYVKMLDEREGPVPSADLSRSFTRRPPWQRIAVLLAGPAFNILFAVLALWGIFWVNGVNVLRPHVGEVTADSIAARAGLRAGDAITGIDGATTEDARDVVLGLLDAVSSRSDIEMAVQDEAGATRTVRLALPDEEARRQLTEPARLFRGLGFELGAPPVLGTVEPGGPAARAGLLAGDRILAIDGNPMKDFREVADYVSARPGQQLSIQYERAGVTHSVQVAAAEDHLKGKRLGRIHVGMETHADLGLVAALSRGVSEAWNLSVLQARLFWRMLMGKVSLKNLSGPLSIAQVAGESAQQGAGSFLSTLILLSLSLGFLNLLPIPILDGGQIVFQAAEWFKGRPLSERTQIFGQQVGIALLIVLMGVALYNDIARQFS